MLKVHQALFDHVKFCQNPFFLTERFLVLVFDLLDSFKCFVVERFRKYAFVITYAGAYWK